MQKWLQWVTKKFSIDKTGLGRVPGSGQALCRLTRADFDDITGDCEHGRILFAHLNSMRGETSSSTSSLQIDTFSRPQTRSSRAAAAASPAPSTCSSTSGISTGHQGPNIHEIGKLQSQLQFSEP